MRQGSTTIELDPSVMHQVAMGMADGQLEQADRWLEVAAGRLKLPNRSPELPVVRALQHLRTACGWLIAAAENP